MLNGVRACVPASGRAASATCSPENVFSGLACGDFRAAPDSRLTVEVIS